MRRWWSRGEEETRQLGAALTRELGRDGLLLLEGELGTGKTVLVKGVAAALGLDPQEVLSPSFTLIREHTGRDVRLIHIDLYRLDPSEVSDLGLEELLAGPGLKVVEWADRLPFPVTGLRLEIRRCGTTEREILERP